MRSIRTWKPNIKLISALTRKWKINIKLISTLTVLLYLQGALVLLSPFESEELGFNPNINAAILNNYDQENLLVSIKEKVQDLFHHLPYQVEPESTVYKSCIFDGEMLVKKDDLIRKISIQNQLFLSTKKIPLVEQVKGLQNICMLVQDKNKEVSTSRWIALKKIIKHSGKNKIFIVGNGPSLKKTNLNLLKNEITIGFNSIFLQNDFIPTIYVVEDHLIAEDGVKEIETFTAPVKIFPSYLGYCLPVQENTIFINHIPQTSFPVDNDLSDNVGAHSYAAGTVTYTGMQIAVSLGFKNIFLVGVDATYNINNTDRNIANSIDVMTSNSPDINHLNSDYFRERFHWHNPNVYRMLQAFRKFRLYSDLKGIQIMNAGVGGQLEVFPRVNYTKAIHGEAVQQYLDPRVAILDYIYLGHQSPTGQLKKAMFQGWDLNSLFTIHCNDLDYEHISAFHQIPYDYYVPEMNATGVFGGLRSLIEFNPDLLYVHPTSDKHIMTIFQIATLLILKKPFVIHYMDDLLGKIEAMGNTKLTTIYQRVMNFFFNNARLVYVISEKMLQYMEKNYGIAQNRMQIAHNYVKPEKIFKTKQKQNTFKTVRYVGALASDTNLKTVQQVAQAVESLANMGLPVQFYIVTRRGYKHHKPSFAIFKHTTFIEQFDSEDIYMSHLANSDLNLLCYNFENITVKYLKYSLANKLGDIVSVETPFVAIGHPEVGTMSFLQSREYPLLVLKSETRGIEDIIARVLFNPSLIENRQYQMSLKKIRFDMSASKHRDSFQKGLREASSHQLEEISAQEEKNLIDDIKSLWSLVPTKDRVSYMSRNYLLLNKLLCISNSILEVVLDRIKQHGISWHFQELEPAVKSRIGTNLSMDQEADQLAFLIVSLGQIDAVFGSTNKMILKYLYLDSSCKR
ncbi:expressed unknown protein [Seminavis robusta]|uniref:6-hydroxymethylpterin diphosphokinase MptE-like domain-containing protein n=1 Tax=Seminavis robusta TaxID=568900 RepID=A0A9N8EN18_9STRA|nr:expressed unknown protein [Seminavis robusta]|eukprot:Sro1592_g284461.1  (907) ;mRNA; r:7476-10196